MILLQWISGCMVGIEFQFEQSAVILDLVIVRVIIVYGDKQRPA